MKLNFYLKNYRVSKNMTQKQLAKKIGITQTSYSFIESGRRKPSYATIDKIASELEITSEDVRKML